MDSLDDVEAVDCLEFEFGVDIDDSVADKFNSISDVTEYVANMLNVDE